MVLLCLVLIFFVNWNVCKRLVICSSSMQYCYALRAWLICLCTLSNTVPKMGSCPIMYVVDAVLAQTALINFPWCLDIGDEVFTGNAQPIAQAQRGMMERYCSLQNKNRHVRAVCQPSVYIPKSGSWYRKYFKCDRK